MSSFAPTKVPKMHECRKERKRRTYRKSNQRAHRTHTTKKHPEVSTNTPRSFANTTIAHSKFLMCIDAKFPHTPTKHPEVSQYAKLQGFGLSKMTLQVSTYPIKPPKFHNTLKSKVSDYPKRPSKFLSTHEVREFLTIPHPQRTRPNTHTTPRSILGSLIASKIRYLSREKFTPWGSRPTTTRATANGR